MNVDNRNKPNKVIKKKIPKKINKIDGWINVRTGVVLGLLAFCYLVVIASFVNIQILHGAELTEKARDQQLLNKRIGAKRGDILDRNGEVLAQSVDVDTVSINPSLLKKRKGKDVDKEKLAKDLSKMFNLDEKELLKKLNSKRRVVKVVSKIDKKQVNMLNEYSKKEKIVSGINIDPDIKRNYPYNEVASNIIGFTGTDNEGIEGIEQKLNSTLMGRDGRIISQSDVRRNLTKEDPEQHIRAEDGKNVYLSLDIKMQAMVEKNLKDAVKQTNSMDGMAIVMNPKNGELLAMANNTTYDLNHPFAPLGGKTKEEWAKLSSEERNNIYYSTWKNKNVTDLYDPGSTFKLVTASIGLEEGVTTTDNPKDFFCSGSQTVADREIKCWRWYRPHGQQSLRQALENSCNPAFIQLGQRIGAKVFYKYLSAFGLMSKTGIDVLGESSPIMHILSKVGPVELATLSFGQRFQITPLQLVTAVSAIANEGELLKPQIVTKIENPDNGSKKLISKELVRKVISKKTSNTMMELMRSVVTDGTGKNAAVKGFNVGGKSGTSEKNPGVKDSVPIASFIGVAPTEDPRYVVLVVLRNPKGKLTQGGEAAAPIVGKILREILNDSKNLKNINLNKVDKKSNNNKKQVPNLVDLKLSEAKNRLSKLGLEMKVNKGKDVKDVTIVDQSPKPGEQLESKGLVFVKTSGAGKTNLTVVPNLINKNITESKKSLKNVELNYIINGSGSKVVSQDPLPGTKMEKGSLVRMDLNRYNQN